MTVLELNLCISKERTEELAQGAWGDNEISVCGDVLNLTRPSAACSNWAEGCTWSPPGVPLNPNDPMSLKVEGQDETGI